MMIVTHTAKGLQELLAKERQAGKQVGFVPTMGALHAGHIALVERSVAENDTSVVSIFVNPTQFNNKSDLAQYPRTLEADCALLEKTGNTFVFAPSVQEIYPEPDNRQFEFGTLASVMEGEFRPGHFNGVAQVVSRLFEIVQPDRAYFGEKDFQQLAIIREMVKQLQLDVAIKPCPIVREADGLAMSSRNTRLTPAQRREAARISQALTESKKMWKEYTVPALKVWIRDYINASPELETEYVDIVDGFTLQPIYDWSDTPYPVVCVAVFAGEVRLIDNMTYDKG